MTEAVVIETIRDGCLVIVAVVTAYSAVKAKSNAQKLDRVEVAVDGHTALLTKDLAEQTARANYAEGMLDKWIAVEKRNDLLSASTPEKVPNGGST